MPSILFLAFSFFLFSETCEPRTVGKILEFSCSEEQAVFRSSRLPRPILDCIALILHSPQADKMIKPSHGYIFYNRIEKVRQALSEGIRFCAPFYITSLIECWSKRLRVRTRPLFSRYLSSVRSFTFPSTSTNIGISAPMRQSTTSYSTSARSGWIFDLSSIHDVCISFSLSFLEHLRNHGRRKILFRRKGRIEVMRGDSAFGNILLLEDWEANWHTISFCDHWCARSCNILGGSKEAGEIKCTSTIDRFIYFSRADHFAPRILYWFIRIKKNNQDFGSQQIQRNRTCSIIEE